MDNSIQERLFRDIKKIEKKYSLNYKDISKIIEKKESIDIPLSIFNEKLGSLESIVKYLKENLDFSIKEISFLLGRASQPVRTTYVRALKKYPKKFTASKETLPISIIKSNNLSVLENLVHYLLSSGYNINQISSLLKRDYKTIWTIKGRIENKI